MAPPTPKKETLRLAAQGNVRAQDEIFNAWLPVVFRWCARMGGPKVDAEDAAHDVFIVVLTRLETLEDTAKFESWLYGITRRILKKHRTKAWVQRWTGGEPPDVEDETEGPDTKVGRSQTSVHVQEILETLPAKQREVLVLFDLEDRSKSEVSQMLGIPEGTVASRLRLARARFEKAARHRALHVSFTKGGSV